MLSACSVTDYCWLTLAKMNVTKPLLLNIVMLIVLQITKNSAALRSKLINARLFDMQVASNERSINKKETNSSKETHDVELETGSFANCTPAVNNEDLPRKTIISIESHNQNNFLQGQAVISCQLLSFKAPYYAFKEALDTSILVGILSRAINKDRRQVSPLRVFLYKHPES